MRRYEHPSWWAVATLLAVFLTSCVLMSCNSPTPQRNGAAAVPANRLTAKIDLSTARAVSGNFIKGKLIFHNPGAAMNLTKLVRGGCEPAFAIILTRGAFRDGVAFTMACTNGALVIRHGTTTLPFSLLTFYNSCLPPNGSSLIPTPRCLPSGGSPPLPVGTYKTAIEWSEPVPLPEPGAVEVVLT